MSLKTINGIFPVWKPNNITSSQFLEVIKMKLRRDIKSETTIKMGHGGTLDKTAQGVLVVGINNGCSKLPCFLSGDKEYHAKCVFGRATTTYNLEGETTMKKSFRHITLSHITNIMQSNFKGEIMQKPPPYSALKLHGIRLSDLAREGVAVDPEPRVVHSYELEALNFSPPELLLRLVSGRGFYVRSLIHDLGLSLGSCAYATDIERTRQGPFRLTDCLTDDQLTLEDIKLKIKQLETVVKDYLDVNMEKFRAQSSQNQRLDCVREGSKQPRTREINYSHKPHDQWEFRD